MANNGQFVKDLPQGVLEKMIGVLDEDDNWKKVVRRFMDVEVTFCPMHELEREIRPSSPGQKLINLFMQSNIKIWHVYVTVATLNLHNCMKCLEQFVESDVRKEVEEKMNRPRGASINESNIVYIHQLPENVRTGLSSVLDADKSWRLLAARFESAGFDFFFLGVLESECPSSPSSEFLKILGDRNFQISHLYTAFASMNHPKAMSFLDEYVSENLKTVLLSDLMKYGRQRDVRSVISVSNTQDVHSNVSFAKDYSEDIISNSQKANDAEKSSRYENKNLETGIATQLSPLHADMKTSMRTEEVSTFAEISYRQLVVATNAWSEEKRLGPKDKGNFFFGKWDDKVVAIKRLKQKGETDYQRLVEELRILRDAKHKNVLTMFNFVEGDKVPCLIYPFMKNGSLCDCLTRNAKNLTEPEAANMLSWHKKHKTAIGVGGALSYLHDCFKCAVVVKSSDIFFNDSMEVVVGDVCLPSMQVQNPSDHLAMYLPRKARRGNNNLDTFSFGIVLLELVMGKPASSFGSHSEEYLVPLKEKIDGETVHTIKIGFDKTSGGASKECRKMWKKWILLCFQETIRIDQITEIIQKSYVIPSSISDRTPLLI